MRSRAPAPLDLAFLRRPPIGFGAGAAHQHRPLAFAQAIGLPERLDRLVLTLDAAIDRVAAILGVKIDWMELRDFLPANADGRLLRSALASSFAAALELARLGKAELRQEEVFGPLHLRRVPA